MNKVEFTTVIHNGIIEVPKSNPDIKDKEVKVIITWEEQTEKHLHKGKIKSDGGKNKTAVDFSGKTYTLQFSPEKIVVNKDKIYELKFPLLCTMEIEEGQI